MKINLELNLTSPNMAFLNYWDSNGQDIVCEIRDNKLFLLDFDHDEPEIKLNQLVDMIRERVK